MLSVDIQKLIEFKNLHEQFMKNREINDREKRLITMDKKFSKEHPDVKFERSNIIPQQTFCAHGTNAWTLFSAFAFTNGQLLPKNGMKKRGIPVVAGELKYLEKEKGKLYQNTISQNFVSTVALRFNDSNLCEVLDYAKNAVQHYKCSYYQFKNKLEKKYEVRVKDNSILEKAKNEIFNSCMSDVYNKLSNIPIVILGDGVGEKKIIGSEVLNEYGYEQVNIRVIIVDEKDKKDIQGLINSINSEIAKSIVYLTNQEISNFQSKRTGKSKEYIMGCGLPSSYFEYDNTFVHDFIKNFENQLPFELSDRFREISLKKERLYKTLVRSEQKLKTFESDITYYETNQDVANTITSNVHTSHSNTDSTAPVTANDNTVNPIKSQQSESNKDFTTIINNNNIKISKSSTNQNKNTKPVIFGNESSTSTSQPQKEKTSSKKSPYYGVGTTLVLLVLAAITTPFLLWVAISLAIAAIPAGFGVYCLTPSQKIEETKVPTPQETMLQQSFA